MYEGVPHKYLPNTTNITETDFGYTGQRECYRYLIELREQDKRILTTSHSNGEIRIPCDQPFFLAEGKLADTQDTRSYTIQSTTARWRLFDPNDCSPTSPSFPQIRLFLIY